MANTKTEFRFFTIADFPEEELWLREEHKSGWRFVKMIPPGFYIFEDCVPEDVIYRLDFKNNAQSEEYMQLVADYGWEHCGQCVGWIYFRKKASEVMDANDGELFSDNASRSEMLGRILRTRMLPLLVIFLCCVAPNAMHAAESSFSAVFTGFWMLMLAIYVYLLVHCGRKLKAMKEELDRGE